MSSSSSSSSNSSSFHPSPFIPIVPSSSSSSSSSSIFPSSQCPFEPSSDTIKPMLHEIELRPITLSNISQLRKINESLFPVHYKEPFYQEILGGGEFLKAAYFQNTLIGTICCRKCFLSNSSTKYRIYIMTLGILGPYRRLGFGSYLIQHVLTHAKKDEHCLSVDLHVQTSNQIALNCYLRLGFSVLERVSFYYRDIDPPDAFFLRKELHFAFTI